VIVEREPQSHAAALISSDSSSPSDSLTDRYMPIIARKPIQPALIEFEILQALALDFSTFGSLSGSCILDAAEPIFLPLQTELAAELRVRSRDRICDNRSEIEQIVLNKFVQSGTSAKWLLDQNHFLAALGELNLSLTKRTSNWRTGLVGFAADKSGTSIVFPASALVPKQMELLRCSIAETRHHPALVRATIAATLLLNAHPFLDGNGRLSRLLFNFVLRQAGMQEWVYIPLYEIARRSNGGYEIALRRAEIFGNWQPLLSYYDAALRICQKLAKQELDHKS
jgi:hypothetical protein